jgi:hypothetical protein
MLELHPALGLAPAPVTGGVTLDMALLGELPELETLAAAEGSAAALLAPEELLAEGVGASGEPLEPATTALGRGA